LSITATAANNYQHLYNPCTCE